MEIKIKKAKLTRGGRVEATYIDVDGNEISMKGNNPCHQDLKDAIARLIPFFADLTEQKEAVLIDWNNVEGEQTTDALKMLDVTGVTKGGDDNMPLVVMTGKRTLVTRRILNLNAPGVEMNSETFDWEHIDDFAEAVEAFFFEVHEYIVNRKWSVEQGTLDFDGTAEDPFSTAEAPADVVPIDEPAEHVA